MSMETVDETNYSIDELGYYNTTSSLISNPTQDDAHFDFQSTLSDIIQIPLLISILLLSVGYIFIIFTKKTFRATRLIWPTINVCLATAAFVINSLILAIFQLEYPNTTIISCRLQDFFIAFAACQMMYAHSVSALNRLLSTRYFHKIAFRSPRWLLFNIGLGWIIGLVVALPYLFYDGFSCTPKTHKKFLKWYSMVTTFIIPLTLVASCDLSMFLYIRQSHRRIQQGDPNQTTINMLYKRDLHLSKVMFITFCIFLVGWMPIFFEQLFVNDYRSLPSSVSIIFPVLLPLSLLCDMILLIYSNQPVRRLIQDMFKCDRRFPVVIQL